MDTPPPVFPTPSEQRFFFFCLILAIFLYAGRFLITGCRLIPSKLLKDDGFLSIHLCGDNLTLRLLFSSKSTKYRVMILGQILDVAVPPVTMTGAPLVFFRVSLYNEEHNLRQGCVSCPINLRGVGNDFSITGSGYMDTAPTFSKKRWEFLYPPQTRKGTEKEQSPLRV